MPVRSVTASRVDAPAPVADVGERLGHARRGLVPPAVLGEVGRAGVERPRPVVRSVLGNGLRAPERAAGKRAAEAGVGEAVLELQGEGAAHRVQTVGGVDSGAQLRLLDRELRQQVELDRVAERLVDADAVLEDGDPLRQPEERRGGEAAEAQRRLEAVAAPSGRRRSPLGPGPGRSRARERRASRNTLARRRKVRPGGRCLGGDSGDGCGSGRGKPRPRPEPPHRANVPPPTGARGQP